MFDDGVSVRHKEPVVRETRHGQPVRQKEVVMGACFCGLHPSFNSPRLLTTYVGALIEGRIPLRGVATDGDSAGDIYS